MVEIKTANSVDDGSTYVQAKFSDADLFAERSADAIHELVCRVIADRYVQEHYAEIAAKLDQNAIANLSIAEASKKIAEEIQRRPNIVREVKTQMYQRGIFGGLRRVR